MSSNQRGRNRNTNGNGGNGGGGGGGGGNRPPKQVEVKDFWGESVAPLPTIDAPSGVNDPSAMVRSLGKPPLPGNDNAAEHYFAVVYERAAVLAGALSAALLE
jgi:hypothetical protein